jgi:alkane 1-monooxygenase
MRSLKYLSGFTIPLFALLSLLLPQHFAFLTVIYAFGIIPVAEQFFDGNVENVNETLEKELLSDKTYDFLLYLSLPVQWAILLLFAYLVSHNEYTILQLTGMTLSVGICAGTIGINVAHELGHRSKKYEQFMAKGLLLSSLYMHFYVEHNRGHHKYVATPIDPATAKLNESVYAFVLRSFIGSYISAWKIQIELNRKNNTSFLSFRNEMFWFQVIQIATIAAFYGFFGVLAGTLFVASAVIGFILLEVINYIEHYGLMRKEISLGQFEKVKPIHSWNSDKTIGRLMLFELTRHADHHYKASKKYQVLNHHDDSPELPFGYPAMMLCSLVPSLFFKIMNPRIPQDQLALAA